MYPEEHSHFASMHTAPGVSQLSEGVMEQSPPMSTVNNALFVKHHTDLES